MAKAYIFYNPYAGNGSGTKNAELLKSVIQDETVFCDMTKGETYETYLFEPKDDDYFVICGGDGTLNRFINLTEDVELQREILYFPVGLHNDFAKDLGKNYLDRPFPIKDYIENLPYVVLGNRKIRFLNGVGFGIDSYYYEIFEEKQKNRKQKIKEKSLIRKAVLKDYKPMEAKVTVDGVPHSYNKVWLAPTVNGRFYSGGKVPAPKQKRNNEEKLLSVTVVNECGKIRAWSALSSIYKGKLQKKRKSVETFTGHDITVEFEKPVCLQIDGENFKHVNSYRAVYPRIIKSAVEN